jgi:hypothetical protein
MLLNRVINGARTSHERARWIEVLRQASTHPAADPDDRDIAAWFLQSVSARH